jgi:hypothetical protein
MKKVLLLAFVGILISVFLVGSDVFTNSNQPPTATTGAPGEQNCSQCHSGASASGFVSFDFNLGDSTFAFSTTYPVKITVNHPAAVKFGFSLTALDNNNNKVGNIILLNPSITSLQQSGGKEYVGHKTASSTNQWLFNWTAPDSSSGVSSVTFYYSANAANGNSGTSGDAIYTGSHTITPLTVGIQRNDADRILHWYSMHESGLLMLTFQSQVNEAGHLTLYSIMGNVLYSNVININAGSNQLSVPVGQLSRGIYLLNYRSGKHSYTTKVSL